MNNPYYKLGPIKEEIIHINPSIWMYHDIASPLERQGIIQTAGPFVSSNIKEKVVTNRPWNCGSFSANSLVNDEKNPEWFFEEKNWIRFFCVLMQFFCIRFVRSYFWRGGPFLQLYYISRWCWMPFFFQVEFRTHQNLQIKRKTEVFVLYQLIFMIFMLWLVRIVWIWQIDY